ncbi:MAG: hypothetical protein ACNA7V_10600 [Bacteroidales bacterium]|jgi:hypothetical protein
MRKVGFVILVIGLLLTIFAGFRFITREKVADIGGLEITRGKKHNLSWSPLIGIAVMAIGGGFYLFGGKKD